MHLQWNLPHFLTFDDDNDGNGLTPLTLYYYRVMTINQSGESVVSSTASATTFAPPEPITNLTATPNAPGGSITLDWTMPTVDNGGALTGVKITRNTDGGTQFSVLQASYGDGTSITFTDTNLTVPQQYWYQVHALNQYGASIASSTVTAISSDVPEQVTNLTATAVIDNEIDLSWTAPADGGSTINSYRIERSTTSGTTGFTDLQNPTTDASTSYTDINLSTGTEYWYRVSAINPVGEGDASTADSAIAGDRPDTIAVISVTAQAGLENLVEWTLPANNAYTITSTLVEWSLTGTGGWSDVGSATGTATDLTHASLTADTTYYYRASSTNALGTGDKSATVSDLAGDVPAQVPTLSAGIISDTKIQLTWTEPADNAYAITGYHLELSLDDFATAGTDIETNTGSTTLTYLVENLTPQTVYYFQVSAINSLGEGDPADSVQGVTLDVPEAVDDLAGTATEENKLVLTWTAPDANGSLITKYHLKVLSSSGQYITLDSNIPASQLTYTHSSPACCVDNHEYVFQITAHNTIGSSAVSNTLSVWAWPTAPSGVSATAISDTEIEVEWTTITGLTYEVEHSSDGITGWTALPNAPHTSTFTHSGLTIDTLHYYRVIATNPGAVTSPASAVVSATTIDYSSPPLSLSLTNPDANDLLKIRLTWSAPTDNGGSAIIDYDVYRSPDNTTWQEQTTDTSTYRQFTQEGLTIATTYYYRVVAENVIGYDAGSYTASVTYNTPTAPNAPSNLVASPIGTSNSAVTLTWQAPSNTGSGVTGYMIERNVNGGGWFEVVTTSTPVLSAQDTNLVEGSNYKYRVYVDSAAGLSANSSNSVEVEMLDVDVDIVGNVIGGNTVTITADVTVTDGIPNAYIDEIRLYKNAQLVDTVNLTNTVLVTGQTYGQTPLYSYPTVESQFYVKVKLIHGTGTSWWTSNTITLTPASSFAGDLSLEEFRTDTLGNEEESGLCNDDACYVNSDLTLNIQPAGTDVIVKYEGVDGDTIFKGYANVQQQQQIDTEVAHDQNYYISVYIAPGFEHQILGGGAVSITCTDTDGDGIPDQPTCQVGDIPSGYLSNMALVSQASPYAQKPLGIEGIGDLFGMPMVFLFLIGFASIFTKATGHMGLIFVGGLIGVMYALGYIDFGAGSEFTWGLMLVIIGIGTLVGKKF